MNLVKHVQRNKCIHIEKFFITATKRKRVMLDKFFDSSTSEQDSFGNWVDNNLCGNSSLIEVRITLHASKLVKYDPCHLLNSISLCTSLLKFHLLPNKIHFCVSILFKDSKKLIVNAIIGDMYWETYFRSLIFFFNAFRLQSFYFLIFFSHLYW